ncbi:S41 family peptidase [Tissierella creatinini]|nr:S41 family peptidase [Tissierella creatinini]TJX61083.1 S41 family peptidase [Soehngenia saccharolytica]
MNKRFFILLLVLALLIPSNVIAATNASTLQAQVDEPDLLFLIETFQYIKDNYPFEIKDSDLVEGGLKGMLQSIDPYSDYYTPEEATEVYKSMFGTFSGIGIYIEKKDSYINIKDTIQGAPGEKAGLKKDDLIISINGIDTKNMTLDNAQKLIQGAIGTKVKLGIKRDNNTPHIYIEVKRDKIIINPVHYEIIDNKIGYIKLSEFSQYATIEINKALEEFDKKNISKVILDLRDNPGGLLGQAIEISRKFVPKGPIVHIKEKNKELITHLSTNQKPKYKLVLLVNENSASASEIVAGAIKDTKAGTIIGKKTFGKGVVQSIIPLSNGSILKLTTSEYLTPKKLSINGKGVEPDVVVENTVTEDLQLKAALKALK